MIKIVLISLFFTFGHLIYAQNSKDCAICSTSLLTEKQLKGKSVEELALLRNEISARKGYVFATDKYANYFSRQNWYKPVKSNTDIVFSSIENQNIDLIKKLETKEIEKRNKVLKDLAELKKALNENNKNTIAAYLREIQLVEYYESLENQLKIALNHIDLGNINWNKDQGLYKVIIDNGYDISKFEIRFTYDKVTISSGMYTHSEIFGDFDDGYSNFMSENESQTWFIFNITESGIQFNKFDIAG